MNCSVPSQLALVPFFQLPFRDSFTNAFFTAVILGPFNSLFGIPVYRSFPYCTGVLKLSTPFSGFRNTCKTIGRSYICSFNSLFGIQGLLRAVRPICHGAFNSLFGIHTRVGKVLEEVFSAFNSLFGILYLESRSEVLPASLFQLPFRDSQSLQEI